MALVIQNKITKKYVSSKGMTKKLKSAETFASHSDALTRLGEKFYSGEWKIFRLMPMMNGKDQGEA